METHAAVQLILALIRALLSIQYSADLAALEEEFIKRSTP